MEVSVQNWIVKKVLVTKKIVSNKLKKYNCVTHVHDEWCISVHYIWFIDIHLAGKWCFIEHNSRNWQSNLGVL